MSFYRAFEERHRGTREDIKSRVLAYINEVPAIPAAKGDPAAPRAEPVSGTLTK